MEIQAAARTRGLSGQALKYIAAVCMAADSVYLRVPSLPGWLHLITRFVAPLFAYLMVEGFFHTRDRRKYALRLWLAALLMQLGNQFSYLLFGERGGVSDNIFLTLALGFTMIWLLECAKTRQRGKRFLLTLAAIGTLLVGIVFSFLPIPLAAGCFIMIEGGFTVLPLVLIAYLFRGKRGLQALVFTAWCLLIGVLLYDFPRSIAAQGWDLFCVNSDWLGCLVVPFLFLYNGKGGRRSGFDRAFFYAFYPAHLWIITATLFLLRQVGLAG